ncbi:MAG: cytochrome c biogenesis protein ResB [Deltaproteobacteria bacterium]|nr:cytochrome c biogenesis protein ResB [Deltaproteobacteria bacterium]
MNRIWNFFSSTVLTVVLAVLICITAAWGSIPVINNRGFFDTLDQQILFPWLLREGKGYPGLTLWIFVLVFLVFLFSVNTFVCTADRLYTIVKKRSPLKAVLPHVVHVGFLIAMVGHLSGTLFGFRSSGNILVRGEAVSVPHTAGLSMRLDGIDAGIDAGFDGTGNMERITSTVTLLRDGKEITTGVIRLNGPLIYRGIAFYHVNQGSATTGLILDVDGERKEAGFGKGFQTGEGRRYFFGQFYPDLAIDASGRPYSLSRENRNPYQEIISEDGGRGLLGLSYRGGKTSIKGNTITLLDYLVKPYAVITVNKDPGIVFIIAGSFVLTAGMALLLFIRGEKGELIKRKI